MLLFDYMKKNKITREKLANDLGYSESMIDQYFRSVHKISARFALLVEKYTDGQVKATELLERSEKAKKKHEEMLFSSRRKKSETFVSCYGVCKICNKKLKEISL
jgi:DNA-binding transcriptional regulator YdaS (Cro superfamily)